MVLVSYKLSNIYRTFNTTNVNFWAGNPPRGLYRVRVKTPHTHAHVYGEHTSVYPLPRQRHGQRQGRQENLDAHRRSLAEQAWEGVSPHVGLHALRGWGHRDAAV